jgi:serine/threonine protein kinase
VVHLSSVSFFSFKNQVLEAIKHSPFLVGMHYAFQTDSKLHLILDYVNGGELFTHLYQREHFNESEVRIYIAEIVLALEKLHKVTKPIASVPIRLSHFFCFVFGLAVRNNL